eukprot:1269731-Prymnesium_polylepis.1
MRAIDFAHAYPLRCKRDCGYLFGLRNLIRLMQSLLHADAGGSPPPPLSAGETTIDSPCEKQPRASHTLGATAPALEGTRERVWCEPSPEDDEPAGGAARSQPLPAPDVRHGSVSLHPDEFYEGLAHSAVGCWCREWVGFERGTPAADCTVDAPMGTHKCVVLGPGRAGAG